MTESAIEHLKQRMAAIEADQKRINDRLENGDRQFQAIMLKLDALVELHSQYTNVKGFVATMKNIIVVAKWLGLIGALLWSLYSFGKYGEWRWPLP